MTTQGCQTPAGVAEAEVMARIEQKMNLLDQLKQSSAAQSTAAVRLHLGCGEKYFNGYINIDYPPAQHTVMKVKADVYADITSLELPAATVDEIRLHHVFEHFNRVSALAQLIRWHEWLKIGGKLHIETPDLEGSARIVLSDAPWKIKAATIRHLAGDQAASWAFHIDQWCPERFRHTLERLGFDRIETTSENWPHEPYLANVTAIAYKTRSVGRGELLKAAEEILAESLTRATDQATFGVWRDQLQAALGSKRTPGDELSQLSASLTGQGSQLPLVAIHDFNQRSRDQWVREKAALLPAGTTVLDVGAGTCPYRDLFAHCRYIAHDFKKYTGSEKLGGGSQYGSIDIESDICAIPVPDGSFDVVICTEVLEHVPDPVRAVQEMARIVKPGGTLLLTAPLGSGLHQLPYHFYGGFTPEWYRHLCEPLSLEVAEITPNGGFFKHLAQECVRAARTFEKHPQLLGNSPQEVYRLFQETLPRYLFGIDQSCFIEGFTVGYHVALAKPRQAPLARGEGAGQRTRRLLAVVFSKDRAMQLDALLRSWAIHCRDQESCDVKVICKASGDDYRSQYRQLQQAHPEAQLIEESDFREDLLSICRDYRYLLFLVDDTLFVKEFWLSEIMHSLEDNPQSLGFSLRLGSNTGYCYMRDREQEVPELHPVNPRVVMYDWTQAKLDFGYPLELSSSAYRTRDLIPLLSRTHFGNPNTLEGQLAQQASLLASCQPKLLCFETSVAFCLPVNLVQSVSPQNRSGRDSRFSAENLASMFEDGFRIDVARLSGFTPNGCHQEITLEFEGGSAPGAESHPAVSIVIPCYNSAGYLKECLESVLGQSFSDWEAIVVDDCSTADDPAAVVDNCGDRRIVLTRHQRNRGLAAARNTGFSQARAPLVLPLDADDLLAEDYLAKAVDALARQPEADCAFTDFQLFGDSCDIWRNELCDQSEITRRQWLPGPGTLQQRALWERTGGYCEDGELRIGNEDWEYWVAAAEAGFRAVHLAEPLYRYRRHASSMSCNLLYDDFRTRLHIYRRHQEFFDREGSGRSFLAQGYLHGAQASWARKERGRAALLAAEAWWISSGEERPGRCGGLHCMEAARALIGKLEQSPEETAPWLELGRLVVACVTVPDAGERLQALLGEAETMADGVALRDTGGKLEALLGEPEALARIRYRLGPVLSFDRNDTSDRIYARKREQLLDLLKQHPLNVALWLELGRLTDERGDVDSATAAYQAAAALAPTHPEANAFLTAQGHAEP